jgi:hypothetical protein
MMKADASNPVSASVPRDVFRTFTAGESPPIAGVPHAKMHDSSVQVSFPDAASADEGNHEVVPYSIVGDVVHSKDNADADADMMKITERALLRTSTAGVFPPTVDEIVKVKDGDVGEEIGHTAAVRTLNVLSHIKYILFHCKLYRIIVYI